MPNSISDLQFSDSTYLVEVKDSNGRIFWPFLQFDDAGKVKDAFCSCERGEHGCEHLDAAYEKIMGTNKRPLHERFVRSLWNRLAFLVGEKVGFSSNFTRKKDTFLFGDLLSIRTHSISVQKKFEELLVRRAKETPENSIKFSNLPQEEISRWREGRPSEQLRYELSFWADFAKMMMLLQDQQAVCKIEVKETEDRLPLVWRIKWKTFTVEVKLTEHDLIQLIPAFETVDFPIPVHRLGVEKILHIEFDPHKRRFIIERETPSMPSLSKAKNVDGWYYLSGKGFFSKNGDTLLNQSIIEENQIGEALDQFGNEITTFLKNETINQACIPLRYQMFFDDKWDWHFSGFLFEPKDLSNSGAAFFGNWAYLPGKGFFSIRDSLFSTLEAVVPRDQVSRFIHQNRIWLNGQKGFETHLAGIESQLTYKMTEEGLTFQSDRFESLKCYDFGEWIYFQNLGFFSKKHARLGIAIRPGQFVPKKDISAFIRTNRDELELLPGFFASRLPLIKRALKVDIHSGNAIIISPFDVLLPELSDRQIWFFNEFVFVEGEGFSELPASWRLPDGFQEDRIVSQHELPLFFAQEWPVVKRIAETIDFRLQSPLSFNLEVAYLARNPEGGLRAQLIYRTELGRIAISDMLDAHEKKKRYIFSEAGLIDLKEERFKWLKDLGASFDKEAMTIDTHTMALLRLDATEGLLPPLATTPTAEMTKRLLSELKDFTITETPNLAGLKSELRTYQKTGLHWLWFLYKNGLSGLLCDEMGLGKTHQAMALLAAISNLKEKKRGLFLVVCPTSVIYHWEDKLAAFLPNMDVHTFHGQKRFLPKSGIVLTSYGMLRSEKESFKNARFELAIFDEIQIAKNSNSKIHHVLCQISASMRVGLTGTPIENNLRELKSLFDIVLPGYMPSEARYREIFVNPIERDHSEEQKALLTQMIRPFILRRRKSEVLQELPEKSEEKAYCDLAEQQIELYQGILSQHREQLISELRQTDNQIPYMHIFSLLSQLKQICNHPALFHKDVKNYKNYQSGKWDLFVELLDESRESDQKVVVFSQYLEMLDIIKLHLIEKGWGFAEIRGSTIDRKEQMRRFQEEKNCSVFLGSLQAAGLGIDLTAASCVFLFDRWWNAARENQAIDRVHRIGQKWAVQVFKLISKGTIEEKIDSMIQKKAGLMEDIVVADDQATLKKFTRSELIELLTYQ